MFVRQMEILMRLNNTDHRLREAALRSFRDSLTKAKEEFTINQATVDQAEEALREAKRKRDESEADCKSFIDLINGNFSFVPESNLVDESNSISENNINNIIEEEDEEEDNDDLEQNVGIQVRKRRGRLHARPKTLELILKGKRFVTVDQVIDLVKRVYEEGVITDKTIKNAVWDLTSSEELKKHYHRPIKEYIYGPPDWFDGDTPKSEYINDETESESTAEIDKLVDDYVTGIEGQEHKIREFAQNRTILNWLDEEDEGEEDKDLPF